MYAGIDTNKTRSRQVYMIKNQPFSKMEGCFVLLAKNNIVNYNKVNTLIW